MYNIGVNTSFLKSKIYIVLLLALFALFADIRCGYAFHINLDNIPEVDHLDLMPEEEFEEKTKPITYTSETNKELGFTLRLPAKWTKSNVFGDIPSDSSVLGQKVLGTISRYVSPPHITEAESFFSVDALALTYEIGIKNWFINYVLTNGLSLERMTVKNKKELEAIYVEVRKDITYIVKTRAIINGSKVVVARYYVPQPSFNKEKVMQAQVIKSFKLTFPGKDPVEDMQIYGFLSQSYFDYPPSWELEVYKIYSIDRMKARLHRNSVSDKLEGKIDISLMNKLSASSRSEIIREFRKEFSIDKYKVDKFIESPEMEYHKSMSSALTQAYQLNPTVSNMVKYELWVNVMESEDYYYLISLITPAREEEFYKWARNIETYKLIVKSMRRRDANKRLFDFMN